MRDPGFGKQAAVKVRLTRLGIHCTLLASFAVFGGAVRNFNLLLVLSAIVFATLFIHWRWGRAGFANLTIQRILPVETVAGKRFPVRLMLTNHNRYLAAWMLRLSDQIEDSASSLTYGQAGLSVVAPSLSATAVYQCVASQRGLYRFGPTTIETTFPFSLFRCSLDIHNTEDLVVLPRLLTLRRNWQNELIQRDSIIGDARHKSGVNEGDFFGLRTWQYGDSPKHIHWRTTARTNPPTVRQFERQGRTDLRVIVDAFAADSSNEDDAENAISLAATMVASVDLSSSTRIVLGAAGIEPNSVFGSGGTRCRYPLLKLLADVRLSERPKLDETIQQVIQLAGGESDCLVISPRSAKSAADSQTTNRNQMGFSFGSRRWRSLRWIDVSIEIDRWVQS